MNGLDVDSTTLRIAVEMQLEDVSIILSSSKGKQRQDETHDFELALASYRLELESQLLILDDKNMCQSMASAVRLDAGIISEHVAQEEQASADRDLALESTDGVDLLDCAPIAANKKPDLDIVFLSKLEKLYVSAHDFDENSSPRAESSSWAAARGNPQTTYRSCTACMEEFPAHNMASCSQCPHEYCRGCLRKLFSDCLTDESLFPPSCCKAAIDVEQVLEFLPAKLVGEFRAVKLERETPNKVYCHKPTCSLFIPPLAIAEDIGTCIGCHQETCIICKGPSHNGTDCPADAEIQALLDVATEHGWQRCYQCRRIVELNFGCYHMTCFCKAQFCYLCGCRWKECACKQWDEARLEARAEGIVARDVGIRRLDQAQREVLVEEERQNLLHNHECTHRNWKYRTGRQRCEECRHMLPHYILECQQCHIMVCRRCRFNRL